MVARALILVAMIAAAGVYVARASGDEVAVTRTPLSDAAGNHRDLAGARREAVRRRRRRGARRGRLHQSPLRAGRSGVGRAVRRLLRKSAAGGHDPLAAELPAGRGMAAGVVGARDGRRRRHADRGQSLSDQKGVERQAVLYWYQGRGRVVANEYANKLWLMLDAARLRRTNGALVRLITPVHRHASRRVRRIVSVHRGGVPAPGGASSVTSFQPWGLS